MYLACDDDGPSSTSQPASTATASITTTAASAAPAEAPRPVFPAVAAGDAANGKALVEKFQCARCHAVAEVEEIGWERNCRTCHVKVMDGGFDHKDDSERWKKNVAHLTQVPDLHDLGKRYDRSWIAHFLQQPHQLRPALAFGMPRLELDAEAARDIATFLTDGAERADELDLSAADATRGRTLLEKKGCGTCHSFTGAPPLPDRDVKPVGVETRPIAVLAPDLRFARDRLTSGTLVAWLLEPTAVQADAVMPKIEMTEAEARDIAKYVLTTPLDLPEPKVPERLPVLERKVSYAEVAEKVLDKICVHCHGNPDAALGDGGPGHSGGFGFPVRKLELTSYERVNGGYLDDDGERQSIFAKLPDGRPRLVASLMARYGEMHGKIDPDVRGMPLALPPLSLEDIQLVETWIAQGRPR